MSDANNQEKQGSAVEGPFVRVLLIGPLPPPMGGNTRHFDTLAADLAEDGRVVATVINTSRGAAFKNPLRNLLAGLRVIATMLKTAPAVDVVSFHASNRGMAVFGPFVSLLARVTRCRTVFRVFGGSFGDVYKARSGFSRWVTRRFVLSCDVFFVQTKRMIEQLSVEGKGRVEWLSTYVRKEIAPTHRVIESHEKCARFVFLGHLRRVKGIETMLEVAAQLPGGVTIDVFGPESEFSGDEINARGLGRVIYKGFLQHEEVDRVLSGYDCLLLPTYHASEGYPGVIAEAFVHGLPVVSTRWLAIPEIVDDSCGVLIEPRDPDGLLGAIVALHSDPQQWRELRNGALARAPLFDHARWSAMFADTCIDLAGSLRRG